MCGGWRSNGAAPGLRFILSPSGVKGTSCSGFGARFIARGSAPPFGLFEAIALPVGLENMDLVCEALQILRSNSKAELIWASRVNC